MLQRPCNTALTMAAFVSTIACGEASDPDEGPLLPPLLGEGERVVFGSDLVDEVCAGTLAYLDTTVASIELELDLEPSSEKIRVFVVDPEVIEIVCPKPALACVTLRDGDLYSSPKGFDQALRHELVHARLHQLGISGKRLFFDEAIAAALDQDGGCLASPDCAAADLDALLSATTGIELFELGGYTAGADMVHGLLTLHGPAKVLAFMDELTRSMTPAEIRSIYLEHFGGVMDEDFRAFMRGPYDEYTLGQLTRNDDRSCENLIPAPFDEGPQMRVEGVMDCGSPKVVNNFAVPGNATIQWVFEVTPELSGAFARAWSPATEAFEIKGCYPPAFDALQIVDSGPYRSAWPRAVDSPSVMFGPGLYVLRWHAELGASFEFELAPPCVFESGGCSAGQQCTIWNECRREVEAPAALGEPCQQLIGAPLACEVGSRCVGGLCIAECDSTQACSEGNACSRLRVCGPACDMLAQSCDVGFSCLPTGDDDELNDAGIGACIAAGEQAYLDSCDLQASECAPGLTCELIIPTPWSSPCNEEVGGCCVPFCDASDATSSQSTCPDETPTCDPLRDGPVGTCWVK